MKTLKFGLIGAIAATGLLVSCNNDSANMEDVLMGQKNPIVVNTYDNMIAQQNGNFDDNEMLKALEMGALTVVETYILGDNDKWSNGAKNASEEDDLTFIFGNETLSVYRYSLRDYVIDAYPEDWRTNFTYNPETNTLTLNKSLTRNFMDEWVVTEKPCEAKVVYFDGKTIIIDGQFFTPYAYAAGENGYSRTVASIDSELRNKLINPREIYANPQAEVDSEKFFSEVVATGGFWCNRKYRINNDTNKPNGNGIAYGETYIGFNIDEQANSASGYHTAIGASGEHIAKESAVDIRIDNANDTIFWTGKTHEGYEYSAKLIYYNNGIAAFVGNLPSNELLNEDWNETSFLYVGYVRDDFQSAWEKISDRE